jgi:hypothetical protein
MNEVIKEIPIFKIMETSEYRKFIKWLIDNNINFHPDDDFNTYLFSHGKKCFSKEVAEKINSNFDLAKKIFTNIHLYKIIRQELRKFNLKELEEANNV